MDESGVCAATSIVSPVMANGCPVARRYGTLSVEDSSWIQLCTTDAPVCCTLVHPSGVAP